MTQYFTLFNLPAHFDIDTSALEQTYLALSARFHPDKFVAASAFEQKQAMLMATAINEAFRILKNPIDRAAYLLQQQGINADAPEHTSFAPEFLMQQMQWRETLMEARMAENQDALKSLAIEIEAEQNLIYQQLQQQFAQPNFELAAQSVRHGRFLDKLQHEIQAALS